MKKNVEKVIGKAGIKKVMENEALSKSGKMKELFEGGLSVKEINEVFAGFDVKCRYNFVYNVISNYVRMNGVEVANEKKESKKDKVIDMLVAGKNKAEISRELMMNYNYIWKIEKEWKVAKEMEKLKKVESK